MRLVNQAGLNLIKKAENDNDPKAGYRTKNELVMGQVVHVPYYVPYIDCVGVCTIGFGTIMYESGEHVRLTDSPISEKRAYELLQYELHEKSDAINRFATNNSLELTDNQFSALCSLAYNCGAGAITNMDSSMRSALLKRDTVAIKNAFRMWTKGTKTVLGIKRKVTLPGLVTRREAEIILYFS